MLAFQRPRLARELSLDLCYILHCSTGVPIDGSLLKHRIDPEIWFAVWCELRVTSYPIDGATDISDQHNRLRTKNPGRVLAGTEQAR